MAYAFDERIKTFLKKLSQLNCPAESKLLFTEFVLLEND
jgi:hypothetical protein